MTIDEWRRITSALELNGWFWKEEVLFAPHETMWFSSPWIGDKSEMCERMRGRLHRIQKTREWLTEKKFREVEADVISLVEILERMAD